MIGRQRDGGLLLDDEQILFRQWKNTHENLKLRHVSLPKTDSALV